MHLLGDKVDFLGDPFELWLHLRTRRHFATCLLARRHEPKEEQIVVQIGQTFGRSILFYELLDSYARAAVFDLSQTFESDGFLFADFSK